MYLKTYHRFSKIRKIWSELYEHTADASPFLCAEVMSVAIKYFYPYYLSLRCYPVICLCFNGEDKPVAGCVLLEYLNGKVQLFGVPNGFNESGFVYDNADVISDFLCLLKTKFGQIEMLKIDERSPLAKFKTEYSETNNVAIAFGENFESHFKTLSSSVRQNVRTAYNRLSKDGLTFNIQLFTGGGKSLPTNDIIDLYCRRHSDKYGVQTSTLKKWFLKKQNFATRFYRDCPNAITVVLTINDKPAAFLSGLHNHYRLIVPRLSINNDFRRYSPGLILICETIKHLIGNTDIRIIDLSQGEEPYKYQLGGIVHKSYRWKI